MTDVCFPRPRIHHTSKTLGFTVRNYENFLGQGSEKKVLPAGIKTAILVNGK